ncbi:uncharacterized protein LOC129286414 [Prosopis cineraria]|uniref:uncharacterized protein LOC129286414 n=1 Tax=Prosopis cineraria TaxID=364024 RepID=UPI00240F5F74|nr:uncharacterized protein LOC129286414 [Prosopis cineraria]
MGFTMKIHNLIKILLLLFNFHLGMRSAMDTITSGQFIRDHETVSSNSSDFKLGFFSPQNSTNRYVGIWYLSESDIIWVANKNQPLFDTFGFITISKDGNLVVLGKQNVSIWSTNVSNIATNSTAKLLNTGNLVLSDNNTGETIWESFQDPSNVFLPKMKLSINKITGEKVKFTSWRSLSDPSTGYYSVSLERPDAPDIFAWFNGTQPYARTGPWNGRIFIGRPMKLSSGYLYGWYVRNDPDGTLYVTFEFANDSDFAMLGLNPQGQLWVAMWNNKREVLREVVNYTYCDFYGKCGAFGSCDLRSSPICNCLNGYEPKKLDEWNRQNWTSGCVRKEPLQCEGFTNRTDRDQRDGFVKLENMKAPDFLVRSITVTEDDCRTQCLNNCSCVAYAFDLNGIGCMHWSGDLIDLERFSSGGVDLYIRVPSSELETHSHKRRIIIVITVTIGIIALTACAYLLWKLTPKHAESVGGTGSHSQSQRMISQHKEIKMDDELLHFDFEELATATNNFHSTNMLGRGGFGSVYKGQLKDGQLIAIKRLSKASRQGQEEFMNEVIVISKLQHRNLVRLLGCCIQQDERMLIYEYMQNKSLDTILFDPIKKKQLDWQKRFKIIEGISRGLLYLHRDSRIKIIHRDLKVSNILLDEELNPKISDFGMARIFRSNEDQASTRKVVGTFGYISPEYAMQGQFSEKSDVFSFGVLLLEIVSGRSNSRLHNMEGSQTLLGYVWKLWNEDNLVPFIDSEIFYQGSCDEMLRCIHIGLLCVQELVKERPTMDNVVSMLNSEIVNLPAARQPSYVLNEMGFTSKSTSETETSHSANFVSITEIQVSVILLQRASQGLFISEMGFFGRHTILFSVMVILVCSSFEICSSKDTIKLSQHIKDPETVSSNGSFFTLGFFSPENSTNRHVGIWYKSQSNIIWVANRNQPLKDSSGTIAISEDGNLVILNGQNHIIWSSNVSNITVTTTCRLQGSGNLVLQDSAENILWQSFEHPSDSFLPQMKLTSNKRTGEKLRVTSWKSLSDPSNGNFFATLEHPDIPEIFIWNGSRPYWRSGPWNDRIFTGIYYMNAYYLQGFRIINDDVEGTVYLDFSYSNVTDYTFFVLNFRGVLYQKDWLSDTIQPHQNFSIQTSECDIYGLCGAFGSCNSNSSPICNCLRGFEPSNRMEWDMQNWTNGCVRKTTLQCEKLKNQSAQGKQDGFLKLQMVKVPDFGERSSAPEETCRSQCLENCTCAAYSFSPEIGCMSWKGNLIDVQQFSTGGLDLYVRLAYSDLEKGRDARKIIMVSVIIGTLIIAFGAYVLWKIVKHSERKWKNKWFFRLKKGKEYSEKTQDSIIEELSHVRQPEVLAYGLEKVATATNNFDLSNKLGQGGFGPVYKGILQDGQTVAVKRLSRASGQGLEEFMNEVIVISKLQHRNLVKLIGCCVEGGEKMLIYEYMPNKSLDAFIFDPLNHEILDWRERFDIIEGVARGVLYLHRDSRLKIIHRDLKASNILLDENLNPKISDFGMARIFQGSEDQANTRRVVGTYGYMSPEYAIEGLFSEKSDVFSFGVLLLEIVSGRRNSSPSNNEGSLSLLGLTWKFWNEENTALLIDPRIYDTNLEKDILRCIHIGLLCVQDLARERPSMSIVVSMLNSEIINLPPPNQPAFIQWQSLTCSASSEESQTLFSNNSVSITEIDGR